MGQLLILDTILSSVTDHIVKWSLGLESNKAERILRYLIRRLYDEGRGHLVNAQLTLAQDTIARKVGISKRWVNTLAQRLKACGWIDYTSTKLPDGTNASCIWRIGNTMKRLLVMLQKSKRGKNASRDTMKERFSFSPTDVEKKILSLLEKEKAPPTKETLQKIPLLGRWLERGKGDEVTQ